jgi:hypothetical protein
MQISMNHSSLVTPIRHFMVVARKGQITIPAPIREALDSKKTELAYQLYDAKKHIIKEICQMLRFTVGYFKIVSLCLS